MDSEAVKAYGIEAGAAVVGIASPEGFGAAPDGFRPSDYMGGCRSVIVIGVPFPKESLGDKAEYTAARGEAIERTNGIAKELAKKIKAEGHKAKEVSGIGGRSIDGKHYGHISLKHAAELAGLGVIGRNYLLINDRYGSLLWFAAVLTDAPLAPDGRAAYSVCDGCGRCVEACPSGALGDPASFGNKMCDKTCFKMVGKKWTLDCFACRTACPHCFGIAAGALTKDEMYAMLLKEHEEFKDEGRDGYIEELIGEMRKDLGTG
ncbi:MAG: 4Fe-4S binding protein [Methanomassiliicoccaceae archaeon]|nr:4Fe-4S binding protein [Methanomassiliicoccaceae archaeon]